MPHYLSNHETIFNKKFTCFEGGEGVALSCIDNTKHQNRILNADFYSFCFEIIFQLSYIYLISNQMTNISYIRFILKTHTLIILLVVALTKIHAQPKLLGNTSNGGNQFGLIFKYIAGNNSFTETYRLQGIAGTSPQEVVQVGNYIYGGTSQGGAFGNGVLYRFEPGTGNYKTIHDFNYLQGSQFKGRLLPASNGKLYGTTTVGGLNSGGILFEFDLNSNTYSKLIDFNHSTSGSMPTGYLIQASNGKIYGTTTSGGLFSSGILSGGTIFEFDITTNTLTKLHDFDQAGGDYPVGGLFETPSGTLIGVTNSGGINDYGVIYEFDVTTNSYFKRYEFNYQSGYYPWSTPISYSSTKLLGTTSSGGIGGGTIYEYDYATYAFTKKYDFITTLGSASNASMNLASNGKLYGTLSSGGTNNYGSLFEYDYLSNSCQYKYNFNIIGGITPINGFIEFSPGKLYSCTSQQGIALFGTLFEYDFNTNTYSKKLDFSSSDGSKFNGPLTLASNGKYYAGTFHGGIADKGVIFEYDYTTNSYFKKIDLIDTTGFDVFGALIHTPNLKLYGHTKQGGANNLGTLFEYDYVTNTYVKKIDFDLISGGNPVASLLLASDGFIYGTTTSGGNNNLGTLFKYDYVLNILTVKHHFSLNFGYDSYGGLMEASNGKIYGMTKMGGINNTGVLFEYNPVSGQFILKYEFQGIVGSFPEGSLIETAPGILYGMTREGSNGNGDIFEFNYNTGIIIPKYNFNNIDGKGPLGTLFKASNGILYGMTSIGGLYSRGTVFEYNNITNSFAKKMDLDMGTTGWYPTSSFIEVDCINPVISASGPLSFCKGDSVILSVNNVISRNIQWYRNGIAIGGATSASYTAKSPGRYFATVADAYCAISINTSIIRVRIPCIPPFDNQDKLSSTPTEADIFLNYDSQQQQCEIMATDLTADSYNLLIADATGRILLNEQSGISSNSIYRNIDCSTFAKGLYIVKIVAGDKMNSLKFVKQR